MAKTNPVTGQAHRRVHPQQPAVLGLRHPGARLGARAVHVPALDHGDAVELQNRNTIRRNAAILPAYSFVLGLLALLGWVAIAAGTKPIGLDGKPNAQLVIPQLFEDMFPSWFAGVAFAAIAIGALVPAAIMSIAAANLFTRNIYRDLIKPDATHAQEAQGLQAGLAAGQGLRAGLRADAGQAERDQLPAARRHLDPADVPGDRRSGLYTRWFHRWALLAGWAVGMVYGTITAYNVINPATKGTSADRST